MEEKNDLDGLLVAFLLKELNAEEEDNLIKAINSDPVLQQRLEELKKLFRILDIKQSIDGINLEEERNRLEEIRIAKQTARLTNSEQVYDVSEVEEVQKHRIYRFPRAVAVAASILFILGLGWLMFNNREVKDSETVKNVTTIEDTGTVLTRKEINISGSNRRIVTKDGSEITLWNQSVVTFDDPFSAYRRDIRLTGKAGFKVAKDKTRPFTVYSGDITTTALGTEFIVTNFEKDKDIIVRLIEGKVVVNSDEKSKIKLKKPIYLLPGQELVYNKQIGSAVIRNVRENTTAVESATNETSIHDDPSIPKNNKGSWYMFNNQSLPQIFDQLEHMFGVEIVYDRKDLEKLYFIGKFEKTDSLEYILKNIATINSLTLSKRNNKFFIRK